MTERPILFKNEMVTAILQDRKNQTRRFKKIGDVGDILWVKEEHFLFGGWHMIGKTKAGKEKWMFVADKKHGSRYMDNPPDVICTNRKTENGYWKRNSLFMPRWASRIHLRITEVRVERVQEISVKDALSEGISHNPMNDPRPEFAWLWDSINGADENKKWEANPYVWVIEFKRIKP